MEKSWIYLSKMSSKTWLYKWYVFGLSIYLTFSAVFSTVNPRFLLEDLLFSKKSVYMKNAEGRAGFEIFWRKSWKFKSSLSNPAKTTQKLCKLFTVRFPKELTGRNIAWFSISKCTHRKINGARRLLGVGTSASESSWSSTIYQTCINSVFGAFSVCPQSTSAWCNISTGYVSPHDVPSWGESNANISVTVIPRCCFSVKLRFQPPRSTAAATKSTYLRH